MAIVSSQSTTKLLTRPEAADYLGVTAATLAVWASTGRYALPMVKMGRRSVYRLSDLEAFIASRVVTSTLEAEALRAEAPKSATRDRTARARRILGG